MFLDTFHPVLAGGAVLPAPAVPASTRISAGLKRIQAHSPPIQCVVCTVQPSAGPMTATTISSKSVVQGVGMLNGTIERVGEKRRLVGENHCI